jgi:hypothetical protein
MPACECHEPEVFGHAAESCPLTCVPPGGYQSGDAYGGGGAGRMWFQLRAPFERNWRRRAAREDEEAQRERLVLAGLEAAQGWLAGR